VVVTGEAPWFPEARYDLRLWWDALVVTLVRMV
jgi:hypothetical protein